MLTDQDRAFLDAILESPGDPVHKMAYADWLREPEREGPPPHPFRPDGRRRYADAWEWMARCGRMPRVSPLRRSASWMRRSYQPGPRRIEPAAALPRAVFGCLPKGQHIFTGAVAAEHAVVALAEALAECRSSCSLEYRP